MLALNIDRWLERASGGAGPVLRWVWALLLGVFLAGFVGILKFAIG
jgi:hypothetical protein